MDTNVEAETFSKLTNIQSFFYGQSVFITGVSGLVGKVVLEKLLRSCPGIGMIYILMRPKRNLTPQERLEKIIKLELFKKVKETFPNFHERIQIVSGDASKHHLGMDFDDYETIRQNASIVIHSAARLNFQDSLKISAENNLLATKYILELCHSMPNIKAVVHVSTSYVHKQDDGSVLEEVPKVKVPPEQLLNILEWTDEKTQKALEDFLTGGHLVTYLVTKAMSEALIGEKRGDLPVAIIRPPFIAPTYKDPFPGWIDQMQGITGLFYAGGVGVMRAMLLAPGLKFNFIPVDIISNAIIASAWHVGTTKPPSLFIFNCVVDNDSVPDVYDVVSLVKEKIPEMALQTIYRYPDVTLYYNKYAYNLHIFFDQWIPAVIIDFLLLIFTGRTILLRVYSKINFFVGIIYRIGKDPYVCRRENYSLLLQKLSTEDAEIFDMNSDLDWKSCLNICLLGGRKFLAREDPSTLPYAKRKARIWWAVTTFLKWSIILYFFYYLYSREVFSPLYKSTKEDSIMVRS